MRARVSGPAWKASDFLADCAELGYGVLPLSDVARALLDKTYGAAACFFQQPLAEKFANELSQGCGYRPYGREYSGSPDRADRIESFTASRRTEAAARTLPNLQARTLHHVMTQTIRSLEPTCEILIAGIGEALGASIPAGRVGLGWRRWSCIQINCAPATPARMLIHPAHEDGHLLTLGVADGPGLEVRTAAGGYAAVSIPREAAIAMPGDVARLMSGGRLMPLYHRVRGTGRERMAILFFIDLDPADCVPWTRNAVNEGVDIGAAVLSNSARFGVGGFTVE